MGTFTYDDPSAKSAFWNSGADLAATRAVLRDWRELVETPPSPGQFTEHLDAGKAAADSLAAWSVALDDWASEATAGVLPGLLELLPDRKSTRLNSSH